MVLSLIKNRINFIILINLTLFLSCYADETTSTIIPHQLPQTCRLNCTTPYGEKLGIATGKVIAYSNLEFGRQCPPYRNDQAADIMRTWRYH